MSLKAIQLTYRYGAQVAVDAVSFSVGKGEIVGFLGPNGAGKSTTMKCATGSLSPTMGDVEVGGYPVSTHAYEAKKITGYLPEHNPLYLEMYVHEYLRFIGGLYGLKGRALKARVEEMVERCGLGQEQNKKIEALSKGYRQRVGLAQALVHDPQVLILDEPTTGLDPNQVVEIRKLVREVGRDKTVVFSTHIMQEVQALCDRVLLIHQGRLVADDRLDNLLKYNSDTVVTLIEFENAIDVPLLRLVPGVLDVEVLDARHYRLVSAQGHDVRSALFRMAADHQWALVGLKQEESSLESIFRSLTAQTAEPA